MEVSEIKWSYSGLKDYQNCPRQYQEVKVLKRYEKRPTKQMLYGTEVHTALENYVKDGAPLAKNYERFKDLVDPLAEMEGIKYPEHRMAITYDRAPCTFGAKNYWVRGIADLLVVDEDSAFIVDYKTGSDKYPDPKQLQLMALMIFAHFSEIQTAKTGLLFVMHEHFVPKEFKREDADRLWRDFQPDLERLKLSLENDKWQENPTPLCGWCPVKVCQFHKER